MSRTERRGSIRLRQALAIAALGAATAAMALGVLYVGMDTLFERQTDAGIDREIAELMAHHRERGTRGLAEEVDRRSERHGAARGVYLFASAQYTRIEGNLPAWPGALPENSTGHELELEGRADEVRVRQVRMTSLTLNDGGHLGVGRDVTEQEGFLRVLGGSSASAFALALLLAIGGGLAVSRQLLQRVEAMNHTILRILGGGADERVLVSKRRDEFDELATHFNRLLDENGRLVAQMREVTDNIAHDLRTPLSRMHGHIEAALADPGNAAHTRETLHGLLSETQGVLETFNALLRIAQIESRTAREQMARVDLGAIARDALELYQPLAEEAGLSLEADLAPEVFVTADRHLLAQALSNLLDNAIKYGGGAVHIEAQRASGGALLRVSDRGAGIPSEDRERVLERFVRLDASRGRPGTGLGLSFVRAVADLHGAELRLSDNEPGLAVTLLFPAADRVRSGHATSAGLG